MKKVIIFTLTLTLVGIPLLLGAIKSGRGQKYAHATVQYKDLSVALTTNKFLQMTVAHTIKQKIKNQNAPAMQKPLKQLKSLRNNEKVLNREIKGLLLKHPKLKGENSS